MMTKKQKKLLMEIKWLIFLDLLPEVARLLIFSEVFPQ